MNSTSGFGLSPMSLFSQLPFEDLATPVYGGLAGWLLLYLCGQFGAVADRVALRRESASETASAVVDLLEALPGDLVDGRLPGGTDRFEQFADRPAACGCLDPYGLVDVSELHHEPEGLRGSALAVAKRHRRGDAA